MFYVTLLTRARTCDMMPHVRFSTLRVPPGGRKLRVILVRNETLRSIEAVDETAVAFEGPYDHLRLRHLKRLSREWMASGAERPGTASGGSDGRLWMVPESMTFGAVELPVRSSARSPGVWAIC